MENCVVDFDNSLIKQIIDTSNSLDIPIKYSNKIIGFGKYENFFLFWIRLYDDFSVFNCRKEYRYESEVCRLEIKEENRNSILSLISSIHDSYLSKNENRKIILDSDEKIIEDLSWKSNFLLEKAGIFSVEQLLKSNLFNLKVIDKRQDVNNDIANIEEIKNYVNNYIENNKLSEFAKYENYENIFKNFIPSVEEIKKIDEIEKEEYIMIANDIVTYLYNFKPAYLKEIHFEAVRKYIYEYKTLKEIKKEVKLSRESMRKMINKYLFRLSKHYEKDVILGIVSPFQKEMDNIIKRVSKDNYMNLFYYGFKHFVDYSKETIFTILLGEKKGKKLFQICNDFKVEENVLEEVAIDKVELKRNKKIDKFLSKIILSNSKPSLTFESIEEQGFKGFETCKIKKNILNIFPEARIKVNPKLVYSTYKNIEYTPFLLLELPTKELVLVFTCENIKFALYSTRSRMLEFVDFCNKNNFSYLICDSNLVTYEEIVTSLDNKLAFSLLDDVLEHKGIILWDDIKEIKEQAKLINKELVAYIINKDYQFYYRPFSIVKKKTNNNFIK